MKINENIFAIKYLKNGNQKNLFLLVDELIHKKNKIIQGFFN